MLNLLIIYDDLDRRRGDYFATSHQDLYSKLKPSFLSNLQALNTNDCLAQTIDHYTSNFNGQPFIFVAYTHGSENALHISTEDYIHKKNAYLFNKTLFYACTCLSAKSLGQFLLDNGCTVFMGFNSTITSCRPEAEGIYQACENIFLEHFINTDSTIQECLNVMYKKYTDMSLHLSETYSFLEGSILSQNLSAFELLCTDDARTFTKKDFI